MIPKEKIDFLTQSLKKKIIFLTGGTGFFGKSFLDFVIRNEIDLDLTILTRNSQRFLKEFPQYNRTGFKFLDGDIQKFNFPGGHFDFIMHFATPADAKMNLCDPLQMSEIIVQGTKRVLDFAVEKKVESVLFASSGAVYGQQPPYINHLSENYSGAPDPVAAGNAYGQSKRFAEFLGAEYSRKYGFEFKIARCFAFIGPHLSRDGMYAAGNFIRDALVGKMIQISGDGKPSRSYLYSEDLIVWLLTILLKGKNLEAYNVGSDLEITIFELAETIKKTLNPDVKIEVLGKPILGKPPQRYVPNINKAREEMDLVVWTDLESALKKSVLNGK